MRLSHILPLTLLQLGCGDSSLTIRGTLLPGSSATDVYVVGQPIRGRIQSDSFVVAGIVGDIVELEFAEGDDRLGRMRIQGWTAPELTLRGVWLDDGTAFATAIVEEGAATVNGLRLAAEEELPERIAVDGVVLAVSPRGDALIVRPVDEHLPDLRVVLTPGTAVEQGDRGEEQLDLEFGDSLRLEGTSESGYVVATRLVTREPGGTEESAAGTIWEVEESAAEGGDERDDDEDKAEEDRKEGPGSLVRPGGGRGRGRGLQPRD